MNKHLSFTSCAPLGAVLLLAAAAADAAKIGKPRYDLIVWGITPDAPTHPLLSHEPALLYASDADAVGGSSQLKKVLGTNSGGATEAFAHAGVGNGGDTFWVSINTPSHFQTANLEYIGGAAQVLEFQSFTKDAADAKLTYTYTFAETSSFVNPESSGLCPFGDDGYCLRAEILSSATVMRGNSTFSGGEVWRRLDGALVGSQRAYPNLGGIVTGDWPWVIDNNPLPGSLGVRVDLPHSQTQVVDLSGIEVGEEFTVWYDLYAYAYDRANLYDVAIGWRGRNASATAKDPLGGDTGVSFDLSGLTPQQPTPTGGPRSADLGHAGSGLVLLFASGKRRQRVHG